MYETPKERCLALDIDASNADYAKRLTPFERLCWAIQRGAEEMEFRQYYESHFDALSEGLESGEIHELGGPIGTAA